MPLLVLLALAGAARAADDPQPTIPVLTPGSIVPETHGPASPPEPYRLGSGDLIEVSFYRNYNVAGPGYLLDVGDIVGILVENHPELSGDSEVRPDGFISPPLLGDVPAGGQSPEALRETLRVRYADKIPRPMISVMVKAAQAKLNDFFKTLMSSTGGATRTLSVRPDGTLSLPLLGEIVVADRTIDELQKTLSDRYRAIFRYIDLTVNIQTSARLRVTVLGEVARPGVYPLAGQVSVVQGVALAGGFLETAKPESVILIRQSPGPTYAGVRIDLKNFEERSDLGYGPLLEPRDIVFVPKTRIARVDKWIDQYIRKVLPFNVGFGVFWDINGNN